MEWILNLVSDFPVWLNAITGLMAALSVFTALTPSKSDDKILNTILSFLNVLAGNVGKNKNADA